jgi:hypothetical protein
MTNLKLQIGDVMHLRDDPSPLRRVQSPRLRNWNRGVVEISNCVRLAVSLGEPGRLEQSGLAR